MVSQTPNRLTTSHSILLTVSSFVWSPHFYYVQVLFTLLAYNLHLAVFSDELSKSWVYIGLRRNATLHWAAANRFVLTRLTHHSYGAAILTYVQLDPTIGPWPRPRSFKAWRKLNWTLISERRRSSKVNMTKVTRTGGLTISLPRPLRETNGFTLSYHVRPPANWQINRRVWYSWRGWLVIEEIKRNWNISERSTATQDLE